MCLLKGLEAGVRKSGAKVQSSGESHNPARDHSSAGLGG